jgi:hypothetical protein
MADDVNGVEVNVLVTVLIIPAGVVETEAGVDVTVLPPASKAASSAR